MKKQSDPTAKPSGDATVPGATRRHGRGARQAHGRLIALAGRGDPAARPPAPAAAAVSSAWYCASSASLLVLLREQEEDERRAEQDRDDARGVGPLVALQERRLRGRR